MNPSIKIGTGAFGLQEINKAKEDFSEELTQGLPGC